MQYSVRFPVLLRCCSGLEETARRHDREIEALRQVRAGLSRLSGMDMVLVGIDRELAGMEEQRRVLLAMAQAVRRAHQIYTATENTVIDEADCSYHPLTELRLDAGNGGALWQVTVTTPDAPSQDTVVEIGRLDISAYAAMLAEMGVVLKAAP